MLKAIQTRYAGYFFRSRLEARWAVFFDALGLKWEYEPQGFELSDGTLYLPDFKLLGPHGIHQWVEVKPTECAPIIKQQKFAAEVRDPLATCVVVCGDPMTHFEMQAVSAGDNDSPGLMCPRCGSLWDQKWQVLHMRHEVDYACQPCDETSPSGSGDPIVKGALAPMTTHKGYVVVETNAHDHMRADIKAAALKARSARFEHGESGSTL